MPQLAFQKLSACNDLYNFEPVTCFEFTTGEFRGRNRFTVVLYDDASRQKFLRDQKCFDGAWKASFDLLAVGGDVHTKLIHAVSAASQSFHTGS